jgi:hypothetical protein
MAMMATAGPASAAHRRVPFGFFGTVVSSPLALGSPSSVLSAQMGQMAKSGVESVRTNFLWDQMEPSQGQYDFTATDSLVLTAASHGLQLLPIVEFTPRWASSVPNGNYRENAPTNANTYAAFLTVLVGRYGPHGSLWAQNPRVPRTPIRAWQVWNEPAGTNYDWKTVPWPSTYTKLLRAAYRAIHRADHGASVVTGAMVGLNTTTKTPWAEASDLYHAHAKGYFDILAVNAFTYSPSVNESVNRSLKIVNLVRQVMQRNGEGKKRIWVTEFTWPASAGRIPRKNYAGFETTPRGQAQRLAAYYARIASSHTAGIDRAFWYTWFSSYAVDRAAPDTFEFSGLVKWQPGQAFRPLPVLSSYASVAAKFEGCRKTANAQKCR